MNLSFTHQMQLVKSYLMCKKSTNPGLTRERETLTEQVSIQSEVVSPQGKWVLYLTRAAIADSWSQAYLISDIPTFSRKDHGKLERLYQSVQELSYEITVFCLGVGQGNSIVGRLAGLRGKGGSLLLSHCPLAMTFIWPASFYPSFSSKSFLIPNRE